MFQYIYIVLPFFDLTHFFSFEKKDVFQNQTKDVFLETRQRGIKPNKMFSFLGNPFCLLPNQKM